MEHNQRNNSNQSDRMDQQNDRQNQQNDWNNESLNTASGLREKTQQEQDSAGSGRSYDYGTEGSSTEEDMNEQLGRNSNQQDVSNPITTPGKGGENMPSVGRNDHRTGMGSGHTTKQSTTGSDFDGQNRTS